MNYSELNHGEKSKGFTFQEVTKYNTPMKGHNQMKKVPVSVILWSRYQVRTLDVKMHLKETYGMEVTEVEYTGVPTIWGLLAKEHFKEVEEIQEIIGVFTEEEFPKPTVEERSEELLPLLPGEVGESSVVEG